MGLFSKKTNEDKEAEFSEELKTGFKTVITVQLAEDGEVVSCLSGLEALAGDKNKQLVDRKGLLTLVDDGFEIDLPRFNFNTVIPWEDMDYKQSIYLFLKDESMVSFGIIKNAEIRHSVLNKIIESHKQ
ncbi:MAG: hypothetical protein Q4P14_03745 [Methanobacteriaceae archaeon]|nr:hypothetical protein [Methanobacteriaceae archaeon]